MTNRRAQRELINCYDCSGDVSFSAATCPHCGSREPFGPHVQSSKDRRMNRIEEKNDQSLLGTTVLCSGIGFFYGAVMIGAFGAFGYGLLGAIIGVPAGFIVNVSRRLFS